MDLITKRIDQAYPNFKRYKLIDNKKNKKFLLNNELKYTVVDGFVKYPVVIKKNPTCFCGKMDPDFPNIKCEHIYFILITKFHLSDMVLRFIWQDQVFNQFIDFIKRSELDIDNKLVDYIKNQLKNDECGICLEGFILKQNIDDQLYECPMCSKMVHTKCMRKWLARNKVSCIYCRYDETEHVK